MSLISQLFLLAISKPIKKEEKKNKANVTNDLFDLYSLYPSISYRLWKTDRCCCCTCPMSAVIWCFLVGAGYKAGNQLPGVSFVIHRESRDAPRPTRLCFSTHASRLQLQWINSTVLNHIWIIYTHKAVWINNFCDQVPIFIRYFATLLNLLLCF